MIHLSKISQMKRLLPLLLFFVGLKLNAQLVNIPDPAFKYALVHYSDLFGREIDTDHDEEISVAEAQAFSSYSGGYYMYIDGKNLGDVTGIEAFTGLKTLTISQNHITSLNLAGFSNLETLFCHSNLLTSINLAGCTNLKTLICSDNQLSSIDVSGLSNLVSFWCSDNNISSLNISANAQLYSLMCDGNQLSNLDISQNTVLHGVNCSNNPLVSMNLKNGVLQSTTGIAQTDFICTGMPSLQYVCADNAEILYLVNYFINHSMTNVQVDANCSFSTSAGYGNLQGVAKIDLDMNGCNGSDPGKMLLPLKLFNDNDNSIDFNVTADSFGVYNFYAPPGNYSLVPNITIPYYTVSPDTIHFNSTAGVIQNADFCILPTGVHNDLTIKIDYAANVLDNNGSLAITYTNKGTQQLSGNVELLFDGSKMAITSATPAISSQAPGMVNWSFSNLQPFESRTITAYNFSYWPINQFGDTLSYTANITPLSGDETPADNTFTARSVVLIVIPITVEYFKGYIQNGKNMLNWKVSCTSLEANFIIERSSDARNFKSIYSLTASNTRCLQPFDYADADPASGMNYYRLKMTDADGKISYSNIVALINKQSGFEIVSIAPNPVENETAVLNITSAKRQTVKVVMTDMAGKIISMFSQPIIAGFTTVPLNAKNLASGIYNICIYTEQGEQKSTRFVKR